MVVFFVGNSAFGPKDLEDVLASVRRTKRKLNKLSVMFNGTGGQGVGNFIAKDTTVREVRMAKQANKTPALSLGMQLNAIYANPQTTLHERE